MVFEHRFRCLTGAQSDSLLITAKRSPSLLPVSSSVTYFLRCLDQINGIGLLQSMLAGSLPWVLIRPCDVPRKRIWTQKLYFPVQSANLVGPSCVSRFHLLCNRAVQ